MKTLLICLLATLLAVSIALVVLHPRVLFAQTGGGSDALISSVTVTRPTYQTTQALASSEQRINIDPNESVSTEVQLSAGSGTIYLLATNGGLINGDSYREQIETTEEARDITFTFQPGATHGHYTVEVSDGQRTETLEYWAGPEPPRGAPGPSLTFSN